MGTPKGAFLKICQQMQSAKMWTDSTGCLLWTAKLGFVKLNVHVCGLHIKNSTLTKRKTCSLKQNVRTIYLSAEQQNIGSKCKQQRREVKHAIVSHNTPHLFGHSTLVELTHGSRVSFMICLQQHSAASWEAPAEAPLGLFTHLSEWTRIQTI